MKIKIIDTKEKATQKDLFLLWTIASLFILFSTIILLPNQNKIEDNKFSLEYQDQCWQSNTNSELAYCSPLYLGSNEWIDLRENSLETYLNN